MSNPTIDLRKDLEAWYDFAPRYYDNKKNRIQDQSGYGNSAFLQNGATLTNNGPYGFGAVQLNQSSQHIGYYGGKLYPDDTFTIALLGRTSDYDTSMFRGGGYNEHQVKFNYDSLTFDKFSNRISVNPYDEMNVTLFSNDGDNQKLTGWDGKRELETKDTDFNYIELNSIGLANKLGGSSYDSNDWDGPIVFYAQWNRVLNANEREYLNRLSAPMRANL